MGFFEKIAGGLKKTRDAVAGSIGDMLRGFTKIDRELMDELEEILIMSDVGTTTAALLREKLEQAVDKLVMDAQADQRGSFLDEVVMAEVLGEIKEIAARGGISCACGSRDYGIKVGFSDVDLICAHCGATLRLDAATPDDIDAVCTKYTLTIPGKKED